MDSTPTMLTTGEFSTKRTLWPQAISQNHPWEASVAGYCLYVLTKLTGDDSSSGAESVASSAGEGMGRPINSNMFSVNSIICSIESVIRRLV